MAREDPPEVEPVRGAPAVGEIPGLDGHPAFTLTQSEASPVPVLIAVPHAGRAYPAPLVARLRQPGAAAIRLEDRYADLLGRHIAAETGASLLVAHAPRAMLDLNRAPDDIDWDMVAGPIPPGSSSADPGNGRRARSGLGLVPRRLPGIGELWRGRMREGEMAQRVSAIHAPYHAALGGALADLRRRWGAALLIDLHSMPSLPPRASGDKPAQFVIGDRFGAACDGLLVATGFAFLAEEGHHAAHNRPYAGGYVLERHAAPRAGIHCLQLEVDRASYLDHRMAEPGEGFAATAAVLTELVRRLAGEVAALGGADRRGWAIAAE
ncbi:N-formylglutamate amidohydrolase [Novosphingobium tardum]|uniref:N-formylglutamate amidohydrolase n=1 Tax=Novosphingobium tardum TaxID=1538021 RepID=A0ABV8RTX4_9SPHN